MCPCKLADDFCPSAAFKRQAEALIILDGGTASARISTLLTRTGFRLQTSRSWPFGTVRSFNKKSVESRGTRRGLTLNLA
jgi:hypothetical protein